MCVCTRWLWTYQQGDGFSYYQDLTSLSAHGSIFGKFLGEPMLVDVRFILLVEDDKMGDYLHPYIESGTLRAYACMYTTQVNEEIDSHITEN